MQMHRHWAVAGGGWNFTGLIEQRSRRVEGGGTVRRGNPWGQGPTRPLAGKQAPPSIRKSSLDHSCKPMAQDERRPFAWM
jgi:hypothetical protein